MRTKPNAKTDSQTPRRGRAVLINVLLIAASLGAAYAVSEVVLSFYEDRLLRSMQVDPAPADMDHTAYAVDREDPNQGGQFAWNADGSSLINIKSENPRLVYEMRPNLEAYDRYIVTNSFGFRDDEWLPAKPEGTFRVVCAGDSITLGWQVRGEETFSEVLEDVLNEDPTAHDAGLQHFEALNMGVAGYNAEQEVETIRAKGMAFDPDFIVIGYCINDHLIGADAGLWRHFTRGRSRTWDFLRLRWMQLRDRLSGKDVMQRSYEELAALSQDVGIPVLVLVFPHVFDTGPNTAIDAFLESIGLPYIDLFEVYEPLGLKSALLPDGLHPSPLGHRAAAEAIRDYLDGSLFVSADSSA